MKLRCEHCGHYGQPLNVQIDADLPGHHEMVGDCENCGRLVYWDEFHEGGFRSKNDVSNYVPFEVAKEPKVSSIKYWAAISCAAATTAAIASILLMVDLLQYHGHTIAGIQA